MKRTPLVVTLTSIPWTAALTERGLRRMAQGPLGTPVIDSNIQKSRVEVAVSCSPSVNIELARRSSCVRPF